jgi:hypothetical protein
MQFMRRTASEGMLMDCQMVPMDSSNNGLAIVIGPKFMAEKYYQQSPAEVRGILLSVHIRHQIEHK